MKKEIMNQVAQMKVAEMRKVAGQYGIKNASKFKRVDLEKMLVDAMVAEAQARAKVEKKAQTQNEKSDKRYKATKVSNEQVEALANAIVEAGMAKEELAQQNRKVLIQVMKKLHCKMWYRTYDKATMVSKIATALA